MKKLYVKNHADIQGKTFGSQGNEFMVKEIVPQEEASRCRAHFVEGEPGNNAYGYHYHETEEEIFYIISGEAAVRTANGEIFLKTGDAVTFPCGPEGAHVIRNASKTEKLVYLDFGTVNIPEIVHLPDINKIMVNGPFGKGTYDVK